MKWIKVFFIIGIISFILACCFPLLTFAQETPIEQKLISLDFENIELVDALRLISAKSDISIIIYPEVKGKVTARFTTPTPVLKVLSTILSPYGFEYVRENNLIIARTLVINDTPTQLQLLQKMITSLDAFSPHQEIFQLKYALAEDITPSLKKYLSAQGDLNLVKDKNQILIIDAPYPLDRAKSFIEEIDKFSLQVEEASFRANYLSFDELLALISMCRSAEGKIEVDSEKGIITVEDAAYPLYLMSQKVNKEDVFIPDKKTFTLKYASATYLSEKVSDLLSDEGQLKVDDVTNALFVVDAKKFIDKITNFIENEDKIENQIITKKYELLYLSVQEAKTILEPVISDFGNVTFDLFLEKKQNKDEDIVIVPQEESSKDVENKETTSASFLFPTVMYVRDLKRNFPMIDKVVQELNSDIWASKMTTRTFYIDKGSVERIALTIANMIGVPIEEVEGLQLKEGGWMQMRIASPTIDLGNIGAIGKK